MKSLKCALGLFSNYSQWIPIFSEIIHPIVTCIEFPLQSTRADSFNALKSLTENAVIITIETHIPLVVDTDTSENSLAASLILAG